jgi:hypothetical protein
VMARNTGTAASGFVIASNATMSCSKDVID